MKANNEMASSPLERLLFPFRGHSKTVYAILASEVFFGTAIGWFNIYRSVYMVALGVSEVQVGVIGALLFCSQALGAVLGGWAAGRFGSKRSMQFFDSFAWLTSIVLWFFARNFWYFAAAALVNGLFYGAMPNWNRILAYGCPPRRRPTVYGLVHLCFLGSGLFGPVAGYFVSRYGIVSGNRVIYGLGFVIVLIALLIRQAFVPADEPEACSGEAGGAPAPDRSPLLRTLRYMWQHPVLRVISLTTILNNFVHIIWSYYSGLYMVSNGGLSLPAALISLLPLMSSVSIALVLLFVIPPIEAQRYPRFLALGAGAMAIGIALFLVIPQGVFWPLVLFSILYSGGNSLTQPLSSSLQADTVPKEMLPAVVSAGSALALFSSIPIGPLAGYLYELNPRFPFYLLLMLQLLAFGLFKSLSRAKQRTIESVDV